MVILTEQQLKEAAEKTLWRPQLEHDACGVGFITSVLGIPTNKVGKLINKYFLMAI